MEFIKADLLADTVTTYDQTKTTLKGRVFEKTINGNQCLGPSLNKFIDVNSDAGVSPSGIAYASSNGRIFNITAISAGLATMVLHTINYDTGAITYIGKLALTFPNLAATTHSLRSLKVIDTGTTGWRIFIATTGSVLINGGLFMVNNVALADFVQVGFATLPMATSTDEKAVYFLQATGAVGAGQLNIASAGMVLDSTNNKIYVHNGVSATHQYYAYNTTGTPSIANVNTSATISVASPGIVSATSHGYSINDQIKFTAGTLPTGLSLNTTYFVSATSFTANSFAVSATSGGAAINTTGSPGSGVTVMRSFGITTDFFDVKTGNLPALTGTLLLTDSEDYALPGHSVNSGFGCAFFATTSTIYLGKLSELTSGATTWPSLISVNALGSSNQIIAPTLINATWSNVLDRLIYVTNSSILVVKQMLNSQIEFIFGGSSNEYQEGLVNPDVVRLQVVSTTGLDVENGWLFWTSTVNVGQRGVLVADLRSHEYFDHSYIISKVIDVGQSGSKFITTLDELFDYTGGLRVFYRTSGFGLETGGWSEVDFSVDLSGQITADQIQFKIYFDTLALDTSIPAQLIEFIYGYESINAISDHWEGSVDNTSRNGENPSCSAFRLKRTYATSVPKLYFRAYDESGVLVVEANTVDDSSFFQYSTNNGTSWNSLGTIPNTAITTELRYAWATPAGVNVTISLREE